MANWKTLATKVVYKTPWIEIIENKVIRPDGQNGQYSYIKAINGAIIVPFQKDLGQVLLIKEYKYPNQKYMYVFPSGGVDKDEEPIETARREMKEEVNIEGIGLEWLGAFCSNSAIITDKIHVFVATFSSEEINKTNMSSVTGDTIINRREWFPIGKVQEMIKKGEVVDGLSIVAFSYFCLHTGYTTK